MGFFTNTEINNKFTVENMPNPLPSCAKCKMYIGCRHPKTSWTGKGRLKTLIVAEAMGKDEDTVGTQLIGQVGQFFRGKLKDNGLDLDNDFWKINSVNCFPRNEYGNTRPPTKSEIQCCRPMVEEAIKELNPDFIWVLGGSAIKSFYTDVFSEHAITRWRGLCIPDRKYDAYIIPQFHPSFAFRDENNKTLQSVYDSDLKFAISCLKNKPLEKRNNPEPYILYNIDDILYNIDHINYKEPEYLSFDYEANCLKPQRPGAKITSISFRYDDTTCSFPYQYKDYFNKSEQIEIKRKWRKVLTNPKIGKVAHSLKFEDNWSRCIMGVTPVNWQQCTMVSSHILDCRRKYTSLNFQTYINFGFRPYDSTIKPYLKSKGNHFNTVDKAPLDELLLYGGLDSYWTEELRKKQHKTFSLKSNASLRRAKDFFHEGILCFADMQMNGIPVNEEYYRNTDTELKSKIIHLKKGLFESEEAKKFKELEGRPINMDSPADLGRLFYEILDQQKLYTEKGNYITDQTALRRMKLPFANDLLEYKKLEKVRGTYLAQFIREMDNGKMYPFIDLHIPISMRSCVAKGTKVLVVRDFIKNPNGIPIENIKVGDYVYCFDNKLNPAIKKVLWSGKTGNKKVIRIHWYALGSGKQFVDVTPNHKIRLINGEYKEAQYLKKGDRILACCRRRDELWFTGHRTKHNRGILEHRFIYSNLIGALEQEEVVHHKDENHLNHTPNNLEKMTLSEHSKLHGSNVSSEIRKKISESSKKAWREGKMNSPRGTDHPAYLNLSKIQCFREISRTGGKIKQSKYDYSTFKRYLERYKIDPKMIKLRYDINGKFISRGRLIKLSKLGRTPTMKKLGFNFYKTKQLYELYGIDIKRRWGNQFGPFVPNNHIVTKIEYFEEKIEVYNLEVEDYHNFFANELCVKNSISLPSFQNIPVRDEESRILCRTGIVPSPGNLLLEWDFSGIEVAIAACVTGDPALIAHITDPNNDMHRDTAADIWMLNTNEVTKIIRFYAKNGWVFPQFYGSYFVNCAKDLWENVIGGGLKTTDGKLIKEHMFQLGIKNLNEFTEHCEDVENKFWNERLIVYKKWKYSIQKEFQKKGYIENKFGFRFDGNLSFNDISNYPIQSTAFHCLLWTLIRILKLEKEEKWVTKTIGQIHDSGIEDTFPSELDYVIGKINQIGTKDIVKENPWINVPLEIEHEITPIDGNWCEKEEYVVNG